MSTYNYEMMNLVLFSIKNVFAEKKIGNVQR